MAKKDPAIMPLCMLLACVTTGAVIAGAFYFAGQESEVKPTSESSDTVSEDGSGSWSPWGSGGGGPALDTTAESFYEMAFSGHDHQYIGRTVRLTGEVRSLGKDGQGRYVLLSPPEEPSTPPRFERAEAAWYRIQAAAIHATARGEVGVRCYLTPPAGVQGRITVQGVYQGKEKASLLLRGCRVVRGK